jgi:hypothetical protein
MSEIEISSTVGSLISHLPHAIYLAVDDYSLLDLQHASVRIMQKTAPGTQYCAFCSYRPGFSKLQPAGWIQPAVHFYLLANVLKYSLAELSTE